MAAKKMEDTVKALGGGGNPGNPLEKFHSYDLVDMQIPKEARPLHGQFHGGQHGYTLKASNGSAVWLQTGGAISRYPYAA